RAADAVDDEPADRTSEGVETRGEDVAEKAERTAALDHHRHPELRAPRGQHPHRHRAESAADDDRQRGLPKAQAEDGDAQYAHKDRRELKVWGEPGIEQLDWLAVPLFQRYVLGAPRLGGGYALSVVALPYRYILLDFLGRLHSLPP